MTLKCSVKAILLRLGLYVNPLDVLEIEPCPDHIIRQADHLGLARRRPAAHDLDQEQIGLEAEEQLAGFGGSNIVPHISREKC